MYINSTLVFIEKDEKYLMLHRTKKKNDPNEGKWLGVGGKFEDGESPDDCLKREVMEETGLTLTDYRFRGIVTFVSDTWETEHMFLYTATGFAGELKVCDEGDLVWVDKKKIPTLPQWEGDHFIYEALERRMDFFTLKLVYQGEKLTDTTIL